MIYGVMDNGMCVNAIEGAVASGAIPIPAGFWIGDYYDGEWHHKPPMPITDRISALESATLDNTEMAVDQDYRIMCIELNITDA